MFWSQTKVPVGLDISNDAIKLVKLKKRDKRIILDALGMIKISPEPLDEDALGAKQEMAVKAIKNLWASHKIDAKKVRSSVSGNSVVVRYLKVPYMSEAELKEVIKFEAEEHIPFNIEHVIIDFQIIKETIEKDERMILVLLVAAKEELIYDHMEILHRASLETTHINVDTFATEDALTYGAGEEDVVALVDIGARMTNINVVENKISCFNRDVLVGGNDFTEAIKRELSISFQEAEKIKEEEGILLLPEERITKPSLSGAGTHTSRISYALESVGTRLLDELERSFAYYYTQLPVYRKNIDRVILSGGSAKLTNLDNFLANGLGMSVIVGDPFDKIVIPSKFDQEYIKKVAPAFSVAVGLALKGVM